MVTIIGCLVCGTLKGNGVIGDIKLGQINAEVIMDIGGGDTLAAVITNELESAKFSR
jgi:molybdopterin-binding protein